MLSFNTDREFFNFLMNTDFREGQFSEGELLFMLKRYREEYRAIEGRKRGLEHDSTILNKKIESLEIQIEENKTKTVFLESKNTVLLNKFKNGLSLWERLTGRVKY